MFKRILYFCVSAAVLAHAVAARAINNTSLQWETIATPHFQVHYHQGAEWTAQQVARIAEEVNGPITALYDYEPDYPVHFIIRDTDDYANGAAFFYENKVEIWATNLEFGFRGTSDWIRNVVTHEYTHIISIQAGTRLPQRIPAIYFQLISFEEEKRSDVLQGYPQNLVTFPFSGVMMPPWFAEGVAQYQTDEVRYDCWDTHRDMILRAAVLEDKMLTYDAMGFFGKNGMQAEQVYDHGYGLVRFIADTYGADAIAKTTDGLTALHRYNMDGALEAATGKDGQQLYNEWKASMEKRYAAQTAPVRANQRSGSIIAEGAYMTIAPAISPDGKTVTYLSNVGTDYSTTSMMSKSIDGKGEAKSLAGAVSSPPEYSRDGKRIVYSRKVPADKYGSQLNDLFIYDVEKEKEERITKKSRAADPSFSPDGRRIVSIVNNDGTHRIVVTDDKGENPESIFERTNGVQIYNPRFSPDGSRIVFGIFEGATRDIATIAPDGSDFRYVLNTENDERNARWTSDSTIVFVSDRTGIFNVHSLELGSGVVEQHTNVLGGAFQPDVSPDGTVLVFTSYGGDGYRVSRVNYTLDPITTLDRLNYATRAADPYDECTDVRANAVARHEEGADLALAGGASSADAAAAKPDVAAEPGSGDGDGSAKLASSKYKSAWTPFQFYPRLVIWDRTFRIGAAVSSFEILDKNNLFFGGSYGTDKEFDGFVSLEIRNLVPTLFAEGIYVREKTTDAASDTINTSPTFQHSFNFDLRYDLWAADMGVKLEFSDPYSLSYQNVVSLYWSHEEYSVNIKGVEFDEAGAVVSPFDGGWKYYVGNQANLRWQYSKVKSTVDRDINPLGGRAVTLHYMAAFDDLFENGEFEYGFRPVFTKNQYNQYSVDWREFIGLPWLGHSMRLRLYGAVIDNYVDSFFWVYMGGRDGIRGYNYYSIGGRKGAVASVTYRFPILQNIDKQFLSFYMRDVYGSVFYETAAGWDGLPRDKRDFREALWKDSVGWELRFSLGAYYVFPTAVSIVGAYAFDETGFLDTGFGINRLVIQEPGWTYYLTVGFNFQL